jgi:hypothetical protein
VTWLYEESGVDGKDLAVGVKLNAIASTHVALCGQIGNELILEPTHCDERSRVVGDKVLTVDWPLKNTSILVDRVLGERSH